MAPYLSRPFPSKPNAHSVVRPSALQRVDPWRSVFTLARIIVCVFNSFESKVDGIHLSTCSINWRGQENAAEVIVAAVGNVADDMGKHE